MGSVALAASFGERHDAIAERGVRVIAYDARAHGRSGFTRDPRDYSWPSHAADMHAFMQALGLERASILGGSMGAGSAMTLALDHPEAIEKLILRAPPPFGTDMRRTRRTFVRLAWLYQLVGARMTARIVTSRPGMRYTQGASPALDLRSFFSSQRREAIVPAIRGLFAGPPPPYDRAAEITHPALVLTHPGDEIHPLASGELLHARMPHARLAVAPTATYWQERPEDLADLVASFVKGEPIPDAAR